MRKPLLDVLPGGSLHDGVHGRGTDSELTGQPGIRPSGCVCTAGEADLFCREFGARPSPEISITGVVGSIAEIQVVRPNARRVVAVMKDASTAKDWSVDGLPHGSMGQLGAAVLAGSSADASVTEASLRAGPLPATIRDRRLSQDALQLIHAPIVTEGRV